MKFVMLYGPSGIGKETIARELSNQTGWKLFPQHLAFDIASAVVGFGNDGFEKYQRKICLDAFNELNVKGVEGLIFTFCYVYPASNYFIEGLFSFLEENKVSAHFVRVACDIEEHIKRVTNPGRKNTNKIQTKEYLESYLSKFNFGVDIQGVDTHRIDSTNLTPEEASREICKKIFT